MKRRLATSEEWRSVTAETLERLGVAAWEWDLDSGAIWWSDNFGPLVGRPRGFVPPNVQAAFSVFHPDDPQPGSLNEILANAAEGGVERQRRAVLPDGSLRWTSHRYFVLAEKDGRPTRICGLVTDIHESKRRREETSFLAAAGEVLAHSLDPDETVRQLASITVPRIADWCMVHVIRDGHLELMAVEQADPGPSGGQAEQLARDYPPGIDDEVGIGLVARTGDSMLIDTVSDEFLKALARDDEHLDFLRGLGWNSLIMVPIPSKRAVLGVVTLVAAESGVHYEKADLNFAEEVIARAAMAIRSALLHNQINETASRLVRLHRVSAKLSATTTEEEAADTALRETMAATGAQRGTLVLRSPATGVAVLSCAHGYSDDIMRSWTPDLIEGPTPIGEAIRTGRSIFLPSQQEWYREFPQLSAMGVAPVGQAWAAVPIHGSEGVVGAIGLSYDRQQEFPREVVVFVESVADQCGVVLERARLFDQQVSIAESLQRALAPSTLSALPGIVAAAGYHPGGEGEVGGDWFDLFRTPAGMVVAVVGDVVGRGIPAVGTMTQLRNALRAYMFEARGPTETLIALNHLMHTSIEDQQRFATAIIASFHPSSRRLSLARAGHLPPVYRVPSGATMVVDKMSGPPLGPALAARFEEFTIEEVEPGTVLALVSDGWIERRAADLNQQIEKLRSVIESAAPEPDAILASLESVFLSQSPSDDDATALIVRFD